MYHAVFRFYAELIDFLPRRQRGKPFVHSFDWRASVKDMIESLGVPHTQIELLVVNGHSVDFEVIVEDGDRIEAYPLFDTVNLPGKVRLRPPLLRPPRFILDIHLGRLAAYLRMMGFDTAYGPPWVQTDFPDEQLAQVAHDEGRVLLTRDIGLLKRSIVTYGYWVRNTERRARLAEIVQRFDLADDVQLFTRCMKCNGFLHPVEKSDVLERLKPDTIHSFDVFHQCADCGRVFWRGSHVERMQGLIDEVLG
jgi:uncharacterized protein with PIN domain